MFSRAIRSVWLFAIFFAAPSAANAQICSGGYPYHLSNGATADATQVNANFDALVSCVNLAAPISNPIFGSTVSAGDGTLHTSLMLNGGGSGYTDADAVLSASNSTNVRGLGTFHFDLGGQNEWFAGRPYSGASPSTSDAFVIGRQGSLPAHNTDTASSAFSTFFLTIRNSGNVGVGTTTPSLTFYVNGTAGGTSAWSSPSDLRLKKDIEPVTHALDIVENLQGVRFHWRDSGERVVGQNLNLPTSQPQIGFIAQDVQKALPEAVAKNQDGLLTLQESKIIPVLVEAVKEQAAQIAHMRRELDELKRSRGLQAQRGNPVPRQTASK